MTSTFERDFNQMIADHAEKDALLQRYRSRAREGERCELLDCPHCGETLAVYSTVVPTMLAAPEPTPGD